MTLPAAPADNRFRILLIEDDELTAGHVLTLLERAGFLCLHAPDPAFVGWVGADPHLVLVRKESITFDGLEVCRDIREGHAGAGTAIPIVMLGDANEMAEITALKAGADDYLAEPLRPNLLMARIVAQLRRAYRYNEPPKPIAPAVPAGFPYWNSAEEEADSGVTAVPEGFAECRLCGFTGSRADFEKEDLMGNIRAVCPQCNSTEHIVFALG